MNRRIIIAGGSGFVGSSVARRLRERGDEVIVLTRRPRVRPDKVREVAWDGATLGNWEQYLDGADALINLTGKNINCVFTPENRRLIVESRVNSVRVLREAVRSAAKPPPVWVQASAVGFYGDSCEPADESTPVGETFLAEACQAWEAALDPAALSTTRCVTLRLGVVLGRNGGALQPLVRLTRCFIGGAAGSGRQYINWIHQEDLNRIVLATLETVSWQGVFNATAPNPVANADFMSELRRLVDRPWSPPAPAFAIRLLAPLAGADPSLVLESQRALPRRLQEMGFQFQFPELRSALENILLGKVSPT